jgi:hypothetical protein
MYDSSEPNQNFLNPECLCWLHRLHIKSNGQLDANNLNEFLTCFHDHLAQFNRDAIVVNFRPIAQKFQFNPKDEHEFTDVTSLFEQKSVAESEAIKDTIITFAVNCLNKKELKQKGLHLYLIPYHTDPRLLRDGKKDHETIEKIIACHITKNIGKKKSFYDKKLPVFLWEKYLETLPAEKWKTEAYEKNICALQITENVKRDLERLLRNPALKNICSEKELKSKQRKFLLKIIKDITEKEWGNLTENDDEERTKILLFLAEIMLESYKKEEPGKNKIKESCKNLLIKMSEKRLLRVELLKKIHLFYNVTGEDIPVKIFSAFGRDAEIMLEKLPDFINETKKAGEEKRKKQR